LGIATEGQNNNNNNNAGLVLSIHCHCFIRTHNSLMLLQAEVVPNIHEGRWTWNQPRHG